jgi:hypothetical protein
VIVLYAGHLFSFGLGCQFSPGLLIISFGANAIVVSNVDEV